MHGTEYISIAHGSKLLGRICRTCWGRQWQGLSISELTLGLFGALALTVKRDYSVGLPLLVLLVAVSWFRYKYGV